MIVTKCPAALEEGVREQFRQKLGLEREQKLFFTTVRYSTPEPVFKEADSRFTYAPRVILVTGIANDAPLRSYLSDTYKIAKRISFPDHHRFSKGDIRSICAAIKENPTACVMTTEKDAQRMRDTRDVPPALKQRLFYMPIEAAFVSDEDAKAFEEVLASIQ